MNPKILYVPCVAMFNEKHEILLSSRPDDKHYGGYWEFAGGKPEDGEIPEQTLSRELEEELAIKTSPSDFTPITFNSHYYEDINSHVVLMMFSLYKWSGDIIPQEGQQIKWVPLNKIMDYKLKSPPSCHMFFDFLVNKFDI